MGLTQGTEFYDEQLANGQIDQATVDRRLAAIDAMEQAWNASGLAAGFHIANAGWEAVRVEAVPVEVAPINVRRQAQGVNIGIEAGDAE